MFGFNKNEDIVRDPVCEMKVDKTKTQFLHTDKGETFYFCSQNCKETFIGGSKKQGQEKHGCC